MAGFAFLKAAQNMHSTQYFFWGNTNRFSDYFVNLTITAVSIKVACEIWCNMKAVKPLVDKKYKLQKFHGKGGWTYVVIPEILNDKNVPFQRVKVKGSIDGYAIARYHLMPMGSGALFLPVKAEIRKKIMKQEGDTVHIVLYSDADQMEIPEELQLCLQDEPKAQQYFYSLSESEQAYYVQWIYSAKKDETRIRHLARAINKLLKGLKFYERQV